MKKSFHLIAITAIFSSFCASPTFAVTKTYSSAFQNNDSRHFFLNMGTGYSFSREANIQVPQLGTFWDTAVQGYNANLGNAALYSAGAGYQFSNLIAVDVEATHRQQFNYHKFQTPTSGTSDGVSLGTKTRYFDLANTSVMANAYFFGSGLNWFIPVSCTVIMQPFIGGGIGVAYNTLSNFHSVLSTTTSGSNNIASIMNPKTFSAFAWQAMIGLELVGSNTWGFDLGYRYFDGGEFKTNNYLTDPAVNPPLPPTSAPPWSGTLTSNEVFLNFKYMFV